MGINFQDLVSPSYLLAKFPAPLSQRFFLTWLIVASAMVVGGIGVYIYLSYRPGIPAWNRWYRRVGTMIWVMGLFALVLLFFRYERIPTLSMRLWMIVWAIAVLAWIVVLARDLWRRVPREYSQWSDRQRIEKYLPKH